MGINSKVENLCWFLVYKCFSLSFLTVNKRFFGLEVGQKNRWKTSLWALRNHGEHFSHFVVVPFLFSGTVSAYKTLFLESTRPCCSHTLHNVPLFWVDIKTASLCISFVPIVYTLPLKSHNLCISVQMCPRFMSLGSSKPSQQQFLRWR